VDAVKHLIRGDDPNESWCSLGHSDSNVESSDETTCKACLSRASDHGRAAWDRRAMLAIDTNAVK
jgi:hypothetical protein